MFWIPSFFTSIIALSIYEINIVKEVYCYMLFSLQSPLAVCSSSIWNFNLCMMRSGSSHSEDIWEIRSFLLTINFHISTMINISTFVQCSLLYGLYSISLLVPGFTLQKSEKPFHSFICLYAQKFRQWTECWKPRGSHSTKNGSSGFMVKARSYLINMTHHCVSCPRIQCV